MRHKCAATLALCILMIAILACNAPTASNANPPDLALTVTSQALVIAQSGNQNAFTATPGQLQTAAPSTPIATVSLATNCRTGPGSTYDLVTSLDAGQQAVVVGKDIPDNYWIINNPNGNGTCWLWGQYATVTGDTTPLPQMSPPSLPSPNATKTPKPTKMPTSTKLVIHSIITIRPVPITPIIQSGPYVPSVGGPAAPSELSGTRTSCITNATTSIWLEGPTLNWTDNADNESGYYVYVDGRLIATLPPNSTSFSLSSYKYAPQTQDPPYFTFGVAAYNYLGKSTTTTVAISRCP